jgi:hypothetical protein
MAARDLIGKRGEAIVCACLTEFGSKQIPYFDPHPLGEKCPTFDYLVELLGVGDTPAYFFVQVKATRQGYTKQTANLKRSVDASDVRKMVRCPVPTYVIGVDEPAELAYIVSVHGSRRGAISSIPTSYPLDEHNRKVLWVEVREHWKSLRMAVTKTSAFTF